MHKSFSRRSFLKASAASAAALSAGMTMWSVGAQDSEEEYVWLSAYTNLPLFVAHDHIALNQIGEELGVKVTIAGPSTVDIPGLVAAVEQTTALQPSGMMVVGWDPSALVPAIDAAIDAGIPVVCVDADIPASKRLAFIGTDWFDLGVRQAQAMLAVLGDRRGKVGLQGLIAQVIDQQAFAGFRSVAEPAGLEVLEPQDDTGGATVAARVASDIIAANPDLVGLAGFDSESGPGIGIAIREAGKAGDIIGTCVDAEQQHLSLVQEGVLAGCVGQKRELFTYQGVKALHDVVHNTLQFTGDDAAAGIVPIAINFNTGTYIVNASNVDIFLAMFQ